MFDGLPFGKQKRIVDKALLAKMRIRPCDVCTKMSTKDSPNQACHILTRGSGGDDIVSNLYSGCHTCHYEQSTQGWFHMFNKYPFFRQLIYNKGYTLDGNKRLRKER